MISRFIPGSVRRLFGANAAPGPKAAARPVSFEMVDSPDALAPFLAALGQVDEVSLDTEADNMYHYRNRVCLLQFLVEGRVFLIDVLAPGGVEAWLKHDLAQIAAEKAAKVKQELQLEGPDADAVARLVVEREADDCPI